MTFKFGYCAGILLAASVFPVSPAWSQQKVKLLQADIDGSWTGAVLQQGRQKPYTLNMTVTKAGGVTDYPDLKCAGKLTRVGSSGGYTFFIETIIKGGLAQGGTCINGSITLVSAGDKLAWGWVGADQGAATVASSTLARK
jgi:hypothetical protein